MYAVDVPNIYIWHVVMRECRKRRQCLVFKQPQRSHWVSSLSKARQDEIKMSSHLPISEMKVRNPFRQQTSHPRVPSSHLQLLSIDQRSERLYQQWSMTLMR
ncbi:hypothetical protein AMECASPLE_009331 [Ameca splendens]|uniref:Uncharacterized protein n=1 Tax=Ameca splendens TaxID=208324 RepID=A0ABV0Y051_9TELE